MKHHWLQTYAFRRRPRVYADHALLGFVALLVGATEKSAQVITHNVHRIWLVELSWQQLADHYDVDLSIAPVDVAKELLMFHKTMDRGAPPIPELLDQVISSPPKLTTEKKMTTEACVYHDFNHRTCLVISQAAGQVIFIPATSEGYDVVTWDAATFNRTYSTKLPDYPPSRCARVFIEYAQFLGATPEAMRELARLTPVTEKEITMATKKATPDALKKEVEPAVSNKKAAQPKAAIKVKVGAATKVETRSTTKAANGEKKGSAASLFKELIMEGKLTDDKIFATVQAEFGLSDDKRSYVKWYRNWLTKEGQNPPDEVV